jgi:hypothetical protein
MPDRKWTVSYYDFNITDHERVDISVYKFTVTVQTEKKFCLLAHAKKKVSDGPEFFLVLLMQIIITLCVCV